jgi:hypothetical protein
MQFVSAPAAPFPTEKHVSAASQLSPSEAKHLAAVKGEIDKLNALSTRCSAPRLGQHHAIDEEIATALAALSETPSAEAAERVHSLIIRKRDAEASGETISSAIRVAVRGKIEELTPLALRILDEAEGAFLAEAEAHRKATAGQTTFSSGTEEFESRVESTLAAFAEKKRWVVAENASAHFLLLELGLGHA